MSRVEPAVPGLEAVFQVVVELAAPWDLGVTSAGHRRIVPIVGGSITPVAPGADWRAQIQSGGADRQIIRADGGFGIDGSYAARTDDGGLLDLRVRGVRTGPPQVLAALARGENVDPASYYFRTTLEVETSHPGLGWMQNSLFVASCVREESTVRYVAYRVS